MINTPIRCGQAVLDGSRTWVMGILNVTPDSFSDGGRYLEADAAVARGLELEAQGADLVDVGGESTRPGAEAVDEQEERRRVVPVIERLAPRLKAPISVDTRRASVAAAALAAGAAMVNDVSGGVDEDLLRVAGRAGVPVVLGHLRGEPRTMQDDIRFGSFFDEIVDELSASIDRARLADVRQVIADPGIGFGKTASQCVELLARGGELSRRLGVPVMLGPSRKAFLGKLTGRPVDERLPATLAALAVAALEGADILRVHDPAPARQALALADAARRSREEWAA